MARVFIGIGSNQGDRLALIAQAVKLLGATAGVRVTQLAAIRETTAVGGPPQPAYLNTAAELDTTLPPRDLLAAMQEIERRLGRVRSGARWAPRPMDLDLLLYEDRIVQEPGLIVPHPRLHERAFVLEPLAQLEPGLMHPVLGMTIRALADAQRRSSAQPAT
jgi:2-amino-4-hydroxy-6-hydroxymethyldihydropteridine diphosphokinase